MEFLASYGMFLIKILTVVIAILITLAGVIAIAGKNKKSAGGKLTIKNLNKKFDKYALAMAEACANKADLKALKKQLKTTHKGFSKRQRLFVIDFHGDIKASALNNLSEMITAIITSAKSNDECLLRLESGGGLVNAYGLAAAQLNRLKMANIRLTIAVDKVAASGGYMMACMADHLIAAPFAIIGSIGVIVQLPNFHRYLEKKNIDFEQLTAGQYKRTLTIFGENTKEGRKKLQTEIDDTHELFKEFITDHRDQLDMNTVATGEHWFAKRAINFNLVDAIQSSDDFLMHAKDKFALYQLHYKTKKPLLQRLGDKTQNSLLKLTQHNMHGGQDYIGY